MQLSPETLAFIREHASDDVRKLALQAGRYLQVDITAAITQIAGRQKVAEKIPSWALTEGMQYPKHLSIEQCSSEITARYKAQLVNGVSLTDLTGGFGVDCSFLATGFEEVTYVERQSELCEIATHNFATLQLSHIVVVNEDGVEHLENMKAVDCIFLDPARRNEQGGKTVAISDCEPNVAQLQELLLSKASRVMVKLSPMLDLSLALKELTHTEEVHVVSVNNECKELLLILGHHLVQSPQIHCINLATKKEKEQHFVFMREQEQQASCTYASVLGTYLYEPNASLLKAGAFRSLSAEFGVDKLHPNSHLYTSNALKVDFPGRIFRVVSSCSFNKKEIKKSLNGLKQANITVRNFPASVAELRKRLQLTEGGDAYFFATTLNDDHKALISCERV